MKKRILSTILTICMVLMLLPTTVFAEEISVGNLNETRNSTVTDPVTGTIEKELQNITVLSEEGEKVSLTQEQRQKILEVWTQYQSHCIAHADFFGVQLPFFLGYNANNEDSLGILGEMLVLVGYAVDDVKNGNYEFDDLMEMIQTFYYANQFGFEFYSTIIPQKRDEAIKKVKESGANTMAQKILVLNDWIATLTATENSQKNPYYDTIYSRMYPIYKEQIREQLRSKIYEEIESSIRQQYYEGAIKSIVKQNYIDNGMSEEDAEAQAQAYMDKNADAISNDAAGFVEEEFGPEAAAQIKAGADGFINEAETEGIEMDPENNPGVKMTIDDIVEDQMDESRDDLGGMTPNQAISVYADQAATDLTQGIMDVWAGSHIGILAEGKGVCAGYSKTLAYLLQYMSPEYYGVNGADTDMSVSANWKTPKDLYYDEEGHFDANQNYLVDMVRITLDAGASAFSEVHYRNAIKIDGKWYYVDSCNDETVKKDIPTFTIDAPDKVCRTQDCEVSVILPDTITNAELTYEFKVLSGTLDTTIEDGKLHAVISADSYPVSENSFNLVIYATTNDNYLFKVSKDVEIQNEHAGGVATCIELAICDTCGQPYGEVDSTNHNLEKISAKDATVTETGNTEYWQCESCKECFLDKDGKNSIDIADTVTKKLPPEIIKGKGQSITAGEKKVLSFTSNAAFSDFVRVELDGKTLDEKNYTAKEGSTVVTLKADYVATLSAGKHTIGVVSENGTASTTFTVNAKSVVDNDTNSPQTGDNDTKSPQTGDNSHMALWFALLFVSGAGVIGTTVYGKKKRAK
ncbi:MAG: hypothetical protein MSA90_20655 [Faecalicatena sp.]|uniref:hypothetical protein n=1 Tax=Faecalicatena sp. TaxID=2005360 RepID=UPI002582B27A|nr:hypothetical protein [Faecalicatena sp.]MCI6467867.1 hypothetical protein [Faecalicatena sp.]MDY5619492.1 hypothetical protein [Lachnospiraceae bacterium]